MRLNHLTERRLDLQRRLVQITRVDPTPRHPLNPLRAQRRAQRFPVRCALNPKIPRVYNPINIRGCVCRVGNGACSNDQRGDDTSEYQGFVVLHELVAPNLKGIAVATLT